MSPSNKKPRKHSAYEALKWSRRERPFFENSRVYKTFQKHLKIGHRFGLALTNFNFSELNLDDFVDFLMDGIGNRSLITTDEYEQSIYFQNQLFEIIIPYRRIEYKKNKFYFIFLCI